MYADANVVSVYPFECAVYFHGKDNGGSMTTLSTRLMVLEGESKPERRYVCLIAIIQPLWIIRGSTNNLRLVMEMLLGLIISC
jgi:hypothetical protein